LDIFDCLSRWLKVDRMQGAKEYQDPASLIRELPFALLERWRLERGKSATNERRNEG
jgi:hypothetical protein